MSIENVLKRLAQSYVYFPFLCAGFVFGLMLLFYRELDCTIRTILVPAFAVYIIGTSIIGYVYFELDITNCVRANKKGETPSPQPWPVIVIIWVVHVIWFSFLIYYLYILSSMYSIK